MTFFDFLSSYWWLVFVLIWPITGIIHSFTHYNHRNEMLKMLKSYADQGKEPPAALLDAMKSDDRRGYDDDYYGRRRWKRYRGGGWSGAVAFVALSAGFGYAGYYGHLAAKPRRSSPRWPSASASPPSPC
ncbi:MAG: hypothetical protein WDN06_01610 [Asticcacaulis sp.]